MPRNISFMLTTEQILNRTKTVTRRLKWLNLKPGVCLTACEKCMGLKKGEHIKKLAYIKVVSVRREPLNAINPLDCILEGFPKEVPSEFIDMFCREMKCTPDTVVTRIEFEYL